MTGLQAAREINRAHPHVRMLILSMYDNEQYFFEALKAGASGYVLKSVAEGYSSREIANTLGISVKTVTGTGRTPWPSSGCGTVWR
jgi:DNA-binding NarL/FixJ family response regulator